MRRKIILAYIPIIFIFSIMLVIIGCKPESKNIGDDVISETETMGDDVNNGSAEKDPETGNSSIDQEMETEDREDGDQDGEAESDPDSVEIEEPPESVELSARHVGGDPGNITMFFDLINGEVSGFLEMKYTEVSLDGNKTVICQYIIEGDINGTVDLESRVISAEFTGVADSEDKECYKGELKFSMKGKISKDYSVARGTTTYGGVDWSVFD